MTQLSQSAILTRKAGQVLKIGLKKDVDLKTPVEELFAKGSIEVMARR
jgi:hypothetical protein